MTEKNEARVRTRAPMVPIGAKTLLSLLMAVVMLVGLLPVTAAAAGGSHPTAVNGLKEGREMCIFWQADGVNKISQTYIKDDYPAGTSAEEKWSDLTAAYPLGEPTDVGRDDGKEFPVLGLGYYDLTSGTLYLRGQIGGDCDFEATTDCSDVLTVIVDGDTTLRRGWCGKDHKGLGKMNIEFCNNATLNIPERGKDMFLYPKAAALDITWTKETSRANSNPDVKEYGDLELSGTGKLNIVSTIKHSYSEMKYGIQAETVTIKDNVSLNIVLQRGTSFSSGILSHSLKIDTTGTVNIDVSNPRDDDVTAIRSIGVATNAGNYGFNLVNAQSVTLKTQKKECVLGNGKRWHNDAMGIYNSICKDLKDKDWNVTETPADDSFTVTMTRKAMPTAAKLTVGDNSPVQSTTTVPSVTVTGGETVAVKASVELPTWLSEMYTAGRVKLGDSRTMNIYKGNSLSSADLVTGRNMTGYAVITNATALPAISFETSNFKPEAGQTYTVYASFPIVTENGGKQLGSASVIATIKAVEKQKTFLNAVELTQGGKITTADSSPNVTVADGAPYEITNAGSWAETASGSGVYARTVTLKIKDATSYGFMGGAKVTVTGGGDVTATNGSVTGAGDTMTTTLTAYKYYSVKFGDNAASLVRAGDGVEAPAYTGTVEDGKEFKGWKSGDTVYTSGDMIPVSRDMTFTAEIEDVPTPPEKVYQFSLGVGEENEPRVQFEQEEDYNSTRTNTDLTVTVTDTSTKGAKLTGLTAKFSDTKFKGNNKWFELYTGTWNSNFKEESALTHELSSLTFDENGKATFGVHLSRMKKTETDPNSNKTMPVGHCYAIIELTATYEGGGEVKGNLVVELTVNERTEYRLNFAAQFPEGTSDEAKNGTTVLVNGTSGVYSYSGNANRGDVVTIKAVPAAGLEFVKWQETNIAPEAAQVKFANDTSAETSFIMPKYDVELTAVYKVSTHTHNYGNTYTELDETRHYRTCTGTTGTCDEPMKVEEHNWGSWAAVADTDTHKRICTANGCAAKQTEKHDWKIVSQTGATLDQTGKINYKCSVCNATKEETIAKLERIDKVEVTVTAPVRNAAPTDAATKDTETRYYVADTEWEPVVTDKFASGTKYTVKVTLAANNGYAFKGDGIFDIGDTTFTINGKKAKVVSGDAQQVVITYEFPATAASYYYAGSAGGTTTAKPAKSPGTGDPGVMLYAAMGLLSLTGGAWVVGRKRKDK